nr:MAG TPA: hypothetical protein [Caudoviricetes sp.]
MICHRRFDWLFLYVHHISRCNGHRLIYYECKYNYFQ